jgi:hypothetical protein
MYGIVGKPSRIHIKDVSVRVAANNIKQALHFCSSRLQIDVDGLTVCALPVDAVALLEAAQTTTNRIGAGCKTGCDGALPACVLVRWACRLRIKFGVPCTIARSFRLTRAESVVVAYCAPAVQCAIFIKASNAHMRDNISLLYFVS